MVAEVKDEWLERRFQDEYFDTNLQYIRIATFLGAVTWAAFGPLAPLIVKEGGMFRDAVIRYGLGVPSALVSFASRISPTIGASGSPSSLLRSSSAASSG